MKPGLMLLARIPSGAPSSAICRVMAITPPLVALWAIVPFPREPCQPAVEATYLELRRLKVRGRVVNASVGLLALAAMMIGATVLSLFLGETTDSRISPLVSVTFLSGVVCFVLALVGFLLETLLAGYTLRFRDHPPLE